MSATSMLHLPNWAKLSADGASLWTQTQLGSHLEVLFASPEALAAHLSVALETLADHVMVDTFGEAWYELPAERGFAALSGDPIPMRFLRMEEAREALLSATRWAVKQGGPA